MDAAHPSDLTDAHAGVLTRGVIGGMAGDGDALRHAKTQLATVAATLDALWRDSHGLGAGYVELCLGDASRDVHRALLRLGEAA